MILNGRVLGHVTHYYWKKASGGPHYHVLLWIHGAPVIDRDDPEDVQFLQSAVWAIPYCTLQANKMGMQANKMGMAVRFSYIFIMHNYNDQKISVIHTENKSLHG